MKQTPLSNIVVKADDGSYRNFYFDAINCNYVAEIAYVYFISGLLKNIGEGRYHKPKNENDVFSSDFHASPVLNVVFKNIDKTSLTSSYRFNKHDVYAALDRAEEEIEGIVISGEFLPKTLVKFKSKNIKVCLELLSKDTAKAKYIAKLAELYYGINIWDFGVARYDHIPFVRNGSIFVPVFVPAWKTDNTLEFAFNRYILENNGSEDPNVIHVVAKNDRWLERLANYFKYEVGAVKDKLLYERLLEAWNIIYGNYCLKSKVKVKYKKDKRSNSKDKIVEFTIKFAEVR